MFKPRVWQSNVKNPGQNVAYCTACDAEPIHGRPWSRDPRPGGETRRGGIDKEPKEAERSESGEYHRQRAHSDFRVVGIEGS